MTAVPSPLSFTFRLATTSGNLQSGVHDVFTFLLAPPMAELRQTVSQNFTTSTAAAVTFDTEDIDSANGHSTSSNTSRYTAVYAGWYLCSGGISFDTNATGRRFAWWRVNGVDLAGSDVGIPAGANNVTVPARTKHIFLAVNDFVELVGWQDSGGTRASVVAGIDQPSMSVRWVSN